VANLTSLLPVLIGVLIGNFGHYAESLIQSFSNAIISMQEIGTFHMDF